MEGNEHCPYRHFHSRGGGHVGLVSSFFHSSKNNIIIYEGPRANKIREIARAMKFEAPPRPFCENVEPPPLVIWWPILERDTNKIGINIVFLSCKKAAERERLLQNIAIF